MDCPTVEELDDRLMARFAFQCSGDACPMESVIGSITAQEIVKVSPTIPLPLPSHFHISHSSHHHTLPGPPPAHMWSLLADDLGAEDSWYCHAQQVCGEGNGKRCFLPTVAILLQILLRSSMNVVLFP